LSSIYKIKNYVKMSSIDYVTNDKSFVSQKHSVIDKMDKRCRLTIEESLSIYRATSTR